MGRGALINIPWKDIDEDKAPTVEETENFALVARFISTDSHGLYLFVEILADISQLGKVILWERVVSAISTEWRTAAL